MDGFVGKALLAVVVAAVGPTAAWAGPAVPAAYHDLLRDWYARYLGRPIEAKALAYWGEKMVRERNPAIVQADILASGEYYTRNGGTPVGFIRALYRDLDGNGSPSDGQVHFWVARLGQVGRRDRLAEAFLRVQPPPAPERGPADRLGEAVVGGVAEVLLKAAVEALLGSEDKPIPPALPRPPVVLPAGPLPPVPATPPPAPPPPGVPEPSRLGKGKSL